MGRRGALLAALALLVTACLGAPAKPIGRVSIRAAPDGTKRMATGLEPVAVYIFRDGRGPTPPALLGWVVVPLGRRRERYALMGDAPVTVTVAQAFASGLESVGVPVVDRTRLWFFPGEATDGPRLAVLGEVSAFGLSQRDLSRFEASCDVRVAVHEIDSGRKLWEHRSTEQEPIQLPSHAGGTSVPAPLPEALSRLLTLAVAAAVRDPELIRLLRTPALSG
jgi:hypothetical protein